MSILTVILANFVSFFFMNGSCVFNCCLIPCLVGQSVFSCGPDEKKSCLKLKYLPNAMMEYPYLVQHKDECRCILASIEHFAVTKLAITKH